MTVFDRILAGELPASFVWQDDVCAVFLDINPVSRGHALVIPKRSVQHLRELAPEELSHLWQVARDVGSAQQVGLGSLAQHFLVNDGRAASQSVPHVHIHVIPRYRGDRVKTLSRMLWHLGTLMLPAIERPAKRRRLDATAKAIADAMPPRA
ncbi:MAG: HIT family protein [Pseudomonadota bacterium]|nr:HIT family protein [Pseudomonadota bacterium]